MAEIYFITESDKPKFYYDIHNQNVDYSKLNVKVATIHVTWKHYKRNVTILI